MKSKMIWTGIILASLTYGCGRQGSYTAVMLPNGAVGSVVECNRKADCFRVASHACHGTYTVIEANDQPANDFMSVALERGMAEYVIQCTGPTMEDSHAQAQE